MYKIGYIDDDFSGLRFYQRKMNRLMPELELVPVKCEKTDIPTTLAFEGIRVVLIDYKLMSAYGITGSTMAEYIKAHAPMITCYILSNAVYEMSEKFIPKDIFDTEADDPERVKILTDFLNRLLMHAKNNNPYQKC